MDVVEELKRAKEAEEGLKKAGELIKEYQRLGTPGEIEGALSREARLVDQLKECQKENKKKEV